jgi:hypothetical protein
MKSRPWSLPVPLVLFTLAVVPEGYPDQPTALLETGGPSCPHLGAKQAQIAADPTVLDGPNVYPAATVRGSEHPEAISDDVAVGLFARTLISKDNSWAEDERIAATLGMAGFDETEAAALRSAATIQVTRLEALDRASVDLDQQAAFSGTTDAIEMEAEAIRAERDGVVSDFAASLPSRLGGDTYAKLQRYLAEEVKPRVTMTSVGAAAPAVAPALPTAGLAVTASGKCPGPSGGLAPYCADRCRTTTPCDKKCRRADETCITCAEYGN